MSTPTPEQLAELLAAAGELHSKLSALNEVQQRINGYRALIAQHQQLIIDERPVRDAAVAEVRAGSVRFRDALQATDPA